MDNFPLKLVQGQGKAYKPSMCNLNSNQPQLQALQAYSPATPCSFELSVKQLTWQ